MELQWGDGNWRKFGLTCFHCAYPQSILGVSPDDYRKSFSFLSTGTLILTYIIVNQQSIPSPILPKQVTNGIILEVSQLIVQDLCS